MCFISGDYEDCLLRRVDVEGGFRCMDWRIMDPSSMFLYLGQSIDKAMRI